MIKPKEILQDFFNLFIPTKCLNCGLNLHNYEKHICKGCLSKIPKTNFSNTSENPVSQVFWGRVKLENAFSFYYFVKGGILQNLIHEIKYKGAKELAYELGWECGIDMKNNISQNEIDLICPVPLHISKEKRRGYNQSSWIARGLSDALNIPVDETILKRIIFTSTQTKKNRQERWENVKDAFKVDNIAKITNKHIMVVDDVLTTGATLEACAGKLLESEGTKVSIVTLAFAYD